MICPKCESEVRRLKFCGMCGNQLLEFCPDCGNWEPIGRPVCETKVAQAREKLSCHQKQIVDGWRFYPILYAFILPLQTVILLVGALLYTTLSYLFSLSTGTIDFPVSSMDSFWSTTPVGWRMMIPIDIFLFVLLMWLPSKSQSCRRHALNMAKEEFFELNPEDAELIKKAEGK